jgi:hypothetical protein
MSSRFREPSTGFSFAGALALGLITSKVLYAFTGNSLASLVTGIAVAALTAWLAGRDEQRQPAE